MHFVWQKNVIIFGGVAYIQFMEYRDEIKSLRKRYRKALGEYYGKGYLIFKTIFEAWARGLYQETDLAFRTAGLYSLSDRNIDKLIEHGDLPKAVDKLTMRVNGCDYLSMLVEHTQSQKEFSNAEQLAIMEEFKEIDYILKTLSNQSAERIENLTDQQSIEPDLAPKK